MANYNWLVKMYLIRGNTNNVICQQSAYLILSIFFNFVNLKENNLAFVQGVVIGVNLALGLVEQLNNSSYKEWISLGDKLGRFEVSLEVENFSIVELKAWVLVDEFRENLVIVWYVQMIDKFLL